MTPIEQLKAKLTSIADSIRERTGETDKLTLDQMPAEIEYMPAGDDGEAYILVDENGNEIPAVLTEEEVDLTATANDIREGVIAVTDDGVIEGTKEIPSYHTTEGFKLIPVGEAYQLTAIPRYDYTKLQAICCVYNSTLSNSVAAEKVSINGLVYAVGSAEVLATVTLNPADEAIVFGVMNNGDKPIVIRYFTYKEER